MIRVIHAPPSVFLTKRSFDIRMAMARQTEKGGGYGANICASKLPFPCGLFKFLVSPLFKAKRTLKKTTKKKNNRRLKEHLLLPFLFLLFSYDVSISPTDTKTYAVGKKTGRASFIFSSGPLFLDRPPPFRLTSCLN